MNRQLSGRGNDQQFLRTIQSDRYEPQGYPWISIIVDNTPAAFKAALHEARACMEQSEVKMCTINAWNEWTERSSLLPDTVNGLGYLEAIRDVFGG